MAKKLTEAEMVKIYKNGTIEQRTREEQDQIMEFMFGKDFIESDDKGSLKEYPNDKS